MSSKCGGRVPRRGAAPRESRSADARGDRMQVRVPGAGGRGVSEAQASPPQPPADSRRRVRSLGRGRAGPSRVAKSPGQHGSRAAEPRGRPTNPLGGAGAGARRAGRRRARRRRPGRTRLLLLRGRPVGSRGDRGRSLSLPACASLSHSAAAD